MAHLRLINSLGSCEYDLNDLRTLDGAGAMQIGRDAGKQVGLGGTSRNQVRTSSKASSAEHASIRFDGLHYLITDLASTNGTYFIRRKGVKLETPDALMPSKPYVLLHGDQLQLGKVDSHGVVDMIRFYDGPIDIGPLDETDQSNPVPELVIGVNETTDVGSLREVFDGILEISRTLASKLSLEELGQGLVDHMPRVFPKGQRFLLFATRPNSRLRLLAQKKHGQRRILPDDEDGDPTYSRTIYRQVIEERSAVIYSDMACAIQPNLPDSIEGMGIKSIICVPVVSPDGRVLGMIQVDANQNDRFCKGDLEVLKVIGHQAGTAMQIAELHSLALDKKQREIEMKHAAAIAKSFLPRRLPSLESYEFFAHYQPCEEVGGDYYHFTRIDDDHLAIGVCDVVGHGVPAALIMANLSSELRNAIPIRIDPVRTLEHLDAVFTPILNSPDEFTGLFFTVSQATLELRDGSMDIANGGHPKMIVKRADGTLFFPDQEISGGVIGLFHGDESVPAECREKRSFRLMPGDVAIIYSDGVIDAQDTDKNFFGGSGDDLRVFGEVIARTPGGPGEIGKAIIDRLNEFTAGAKVEDDITLVCFGLKPDFRATHA